MPTSTIELPDGFANNILDFATAQLAALSPYLVLVIGVILAVVVAGILIGFLHKH